LEEGFLLEEDLTGFCVEEGEVDLAAVLGPGDADDGPAIGGEFSLEAVVAGYGLVSGDEFLGGDAPLFSVEARRVEDNAL
jgi:hypothetical protein